MRAVRLAEDWAVFRRDEKGVMLVMTCETLEEADSRARSLNRANLWSGWRYYARHLAAARWEVRERYPSGREHVLAVTPSWRLAVAQAGDLARFHAGECRRANLSPWLLFVVVEQREEERG